MKNRFIPNAVLKGLNCFPLKRFSCFMGPQSLHFLDFKVVDNYDSSRRFQVSKKWNSIYCLFSFEDIGPQNNCLWISAFSHTLEYTAQSHNYLDSSLPNVLWGQSWDVCINIFLEYLLRKTYIHEIYHQRLGFRKFQWSQGYFPSILGYVPSILGGCDCS